MSKQYLADMLKSMTTGDEEGAKAAFAKYATEKTQEIIARGVEPQEPEAAPADDTPPAEPAVTDSTEEGTTE